MLRCNTALRGFLNCLGYFFPLFPICFISFVRFYEKKQKNEFAAIFEIQTGIVLERGNLEVYSMAASWRAWR